MRWLASAFFMVSLIFALTLGPQMRAWSWGPAMLALALATAFALPGMFQQARPIPIGITLLGLVTAGWFGLRMVSSPVAESAMADGLLLAATVASFVIAQVVFHRPGLERMVVWTIAVLTAVSVGLVAKQLSDPGYSLIFPRLDITLPTGFFAHYNEGANFLIGTSLLLGALALFSPYSKWERGAWGVIAIAGMAAVYFMRSRGGIFGASAGLAALSVGALIQAKRVQAKWFSVGVIAVPMIAIGVIAFLVVGWEDAQEVRGQEGGIEGLMDNSIRLHMLGMAASCFELHPWIGGGSRSFAWECYEFWDSQAIGHGIVRPDLVHNEMAQAFTDYGLVGGGLLIVLLSACVLLALVRLLTSSAQAVAASAGWWVGGLAVVVGLVAHSNFSFVFHLLPACLLLGWALAAVCRSSVDPAKTRPAVGMVTSFGLLLLAAGALSVLPRQGWLGTRVTLALRDAYFGDRSLASSARLSAIARANAIWPNSGLHMDRAKILHERVVAGDDDEHEVEAALRDYRAAGTLQPLEPASWVNRANLLSFLQRDEEAEAAYERAAALQGGMEPAFLARSSYAKHEYRKGRELLKQRRLVDAQVAMERAAVQIEQAFALSPGWLSADIRSLRVAIHEWLGMVREANGDPEGALAAYDHAASIPSGPTAHYRAAQMLGRQAAESWGKRQPSQALSGFLAARERLSKASLPAGVSAAQRAELKQYFDETIKFLEGAKVQPAP